MSWSVKKIGTKTEVRAAVDTEFAKQAANYAGKDEEKDVLAARDRVLAAIDGSTAQPWANGLEVDANGSNGGGYLSLNVRVTCIQLELPPSPAVATPAEPTPPPAAPAP